MDLDGRWLGYVADLTVAAHLGYVGYVVLGQAFILLGMALRSSWIRGAWFRNSHFVMVWIVAIEALFGIKCPLTVWENRLREAANQPFSERTFVGRLFDRILFVDDDGAVQEQREQAQQAALLNETSDSEASTVVPHAAPTTEHVAPTEVDLTIEYVAFALLTSLTYVLAPPRRQQNV